MTRDNFGMVNAVFWSFQIEKNGLTSMSSGSFDLEPSDNPIPFENLTSQIVSEWLESLIDPERLSDIKHFLEQQVDYKLNNRFTGEILENISGLPGNFT